MLCEKCNKLPIEWVDTFCQDCWESHCASEWWKLVPRLQDAIIKGERI